MSNIPTPQDIREMIERLNARRALFDSTHDRHLFDDLTHLLRRMASPTPPKDTEED